MTADTVPLRPKRPCPICGRASVQKYHPFCSARCANSDLHRWFAGSYALDGGAAAGTDENKEKD